MRLQCSNVPTRTAIEEAKNGSARFLLSQEMPVGIDGTLICAEAYDPSAGLRHLLGEVFLADPVDTPHATSLVQAFDLADFAGWYVCRIVAFGDSRLENLRLQDSQRISRECAALDTIKFVVLR